MASTKEKKATIEEWASQFTGLEIWKNQFLIRRNGPLIAGICLDEMRDSKTYKPTAFFHNLLIPFPVVSLSYAAPLTSRGMYLPLKYGGVNEEQVSQFKAQVPWLSEGLSFASFVGHIRAARSGKFGAQAIYLPHAFRDIASVGACLGDAEYYNSTLSDAAAAIAEVPNLNLNLIGSVDAWRQETSAILESDFESLVQSNLRKLKLSDLKDDGMPFERIENYWSSI